MWEMSINPNKVFELRCKNTTYFGIGAINKINDILDYFKEHGITKVLLVTGRGSYKVSGAWDVVKPALDERGYEYKLYNKVGPNPTVDMIDEATKMGKELGAQAIISIGGGSPADTAKSVSVLLKYTDKDARQLYNLEFAPEDAVPLVTINITHGTGTEVDRFAVATIPEKNHKPAIAYECLYPKFAIDDPALMKNLSRTQTIAVTVDAVNHVIEAATSKVASPYSILTAKETIRLVTKYLPIVLKDLENLTARYYLLYASLLGGISFDNGMLHLTHALEHPLSAVKPDLSHGLGLGAILPAVIEAIYPAESEVLSDILYPIVPDLEGLPAEAEYAAYKVEEWLFSVGCTDKLSDFGFTKDDIPKLVELAKTTPSLDGLLSIAPVPATDEVISGIFKKSLEPFVH